MLPRTQPYPSAISGPAEASDIGTRRRAEPPKEGCAVADGFSLHAAVRISADDVEGRERLLRYVLRPPFASERLEEDERGRIVYRLKRRRRDGATHLLLTPMELMEKLAALVPEARAHLVQYHGVLAPNAKWRKQVAAADLFAAEPAKGDDGPWGPGGQSKKDWATMLKKTFGIDVLKCPRCGGRMRLIAVITKSAVIRKILTAMGYDLRGPGRGPPGTAGGSTIE